MTNAEKQAAYKARMYAAGYKQRQIWVKGDLLAELEADRDAAYQRHEAERDPLAREFAAGQVDGLCHALQRLYGLFGGGGGENTRPGPENGS